MSSTVRAHGSVGGAKGSVDVFSGEAERLPLSLCQPVVPQARFMVSQS